MSKKNSKSKGGKGPKGKLTTASKPVSQAVSSSNEMSSPNDALTLKYPAFDGVSFAPTMSSEAIKAVESWIGSPLRILLSDGRSIIGDLVSLDNYRNLILSNTYQAHMSATPGVEGSASTKQMGLILVPGQEIVKIERGLKASPSEPTNA